LHANGGQRSQGLNEPILFRILVDDPGSTLDAHFTVRTDFRLARDVAPAGILSPRRPNLSTNRVKVYVQSGESSSLTNRAYDY